jgi:hypothetical protein
VCTNASWNLFDVRAPRGKGGVDAFLIGPAQT